MELQVVDKAPLLPTPEEGDTTFPSHETLHTEEEEEDEGEREGDEEDEGDEVGGVKEYRSIRSRVSGFFYSCFFNEERRWGRSCKKICKFCGIIQRKPGTMTSWYYVGW